MKFLVGMGAATMRERWQRFCATASPLPNGRDSQLPPRGDKSTCGLTPPPLARIPARQVGILRFHPTSEPVMSLLSYFSKWRKSAKPARRAHRRLVSRLEGLEERALPATFTVTTALDVVNPTDGKLSLRESINAANAHAGADTLMVPAARAILFRAPASLLHPKGGTAGNSCEFLAATVTTRAGTCTRKVEWRKSPVVRNEWRSILRQPSKISARQ